MRPKQMPSDFSGEIDPGEQRCGQRLRQDLGVNPAGIEVILRLRSQVRQLQARLRQLEAVLEERRTGREIRLAHYRRVQVEATWYELEDTDETAGR